MSVRVAREFQGRWSCFWATSYSLELELFDEYLFRRLGEPPLNATLLVDFRRLATSLGKLGPEDSRRLQRANRDYLLRGVPIGGSFHPKTYFFGNSKEGVLLVGSGNLTLRGIEEGHELFARLDSREPDDLASIRGWRDWMDAIVERAADREVSYRWLDLKQRTPWLDGPAGEPRFVSNLRLSLLEQLAAPLATPVDELHVLAPTTTATRTRFEPCLTACVRASSPSTSARVRASTAPRLRNYSARPMLASPSARSSRTNSCTRSSSASWLARRADS